MFNQCGNISVALVQLPTHLGNQRISGGSIDGLRTPYSYEVNSFEETTLTIAYEPSSANPRLNFHRCFEVSEAGCHQAEKCIGVCLLAETKDLDNQLGAVVAGEFSSVYGLIASPKEPRLNKVGVVVRGRASKSADAIRQ